MKRTKQTNAILTDTSYRAQDAALVPNAEPGFDAEGRGLHYVAQAGAKTGYAPAQETPTHSYPEEPVHDPNVKGQP